MSEEPSAPPPARKPSSRLVYVLDVVLVRLRFIGLLAVVTLLAAYWDDIAAHVERWMPHAPRGASHGAADREFFCPMHPHVVRTDAGNCPICGMPLSERRKGVAEKLPDGVLARVQFSPYRIAQGGIRTSPAEWRPLEREIAAAGVVEFDERKLSRIVARFGGRVESLAVDFVGARVERGRPLATLYSPDVFAAEEALVSALRGAAAAAAATPPDERLAERNRGLAASARARLLAWGLLPEQVDAIEASGRASPTVEVLAPISGVVTARLVVAGDSVMEGGALFDVADLSTVWVKASVHEADAALVAPGQTLTATSTAFAGEAFTGAVAFVDPVVDRATRTVTVRADLPNAGLRLKPGMYVTATLRAPLASAEPFASMPRPQANAAPRTEYWCPMHPDVVRDAPGRCEKCGGMELVRRELAAGPGPRDVLALPDAAVLDTGTRRVVYVESSPGVFDAREVVVGPRAGSWYPVVRGVAAGERVATAGAFLVDAETRLDPAAAGAYFGASGTSR